MVVKSGFEESERAWRQFDRAHARGRGPAFWHQGQADKATLLEHKSLACVRGVVVVGEARATHNFLEAEVARARVVQ